jgi:hypothetical protein
VSFSDHCSDSELASPDAPGPGKAETMIDKLKADFANIDKLASVRTAVGLPPVLTGEPRSDTCVAFGQHAGLLPATNVVSITEARAKRKALRERVL